MTGGELLFEATGAAAEPPGDYERGWRDGYAVAVAEIKAVEHGVYDLLAGRAEVERRRWQLRGEQRTRATFGDPHPADYPGQGGAA